MPRKDHLPRQTRQEHITLQPNRSIEFRVTDDFGSFSPPHWHDALEIIYILEGSSIVTLSDRTKTVLPGQFLLINSGRIHTARCPSTGNRSILMQIPDAFLANYLPDPSQLWFSIDYDSTNPEVQKNISQFRRLLLSMMQLHEEMPDGYLLTFQRELFTFLDLLYTKFSEKSSKVFQNIIDEAEADLRDLMGIPSNYKVLFLQGSASLQFSMIPMNLMKNGVADYIVTGQWAKKAYAEAQKYGKANKIASSEDKTFSYIPDCSDLPISPDADYVYICENNTIYGTKYKKLPNTKGKTLVADVSSCFLSEPVNVSDYGIIYGGVQKNIGPAGMVSNV